MYGNTDLKRLYAEICDVEEEHVTMYETLKKAAEKNDTVIYFTISSKASGQNHTATMAVDEIKEVILKSSR